VSKAANIRTHKDVTAATFRFVLAPCSPMLVSNLPSNLNSNTRAWDTAEDSRVYATCDALFHLAPCPSSMSFPFSVVDNDVTSNGQR